MHVADKINFSHNTQAIATSTLSDFMFRRCSRGDVMRQILCSVFKLFTTDTGVFWLGSIFNTSRCSENLRERRESSLYFGTNQKTFKTPFQSPIDFST